MRGRERWKEERREKREREAGPNVSHRLVSPVLARLFTILEGRGGGTHRATTRYGSHGFRTWRGRDVATVHNGGRSMHPATCCE